MDPLTVAIGLGLVVSLLFTEAFGLAAGGMIVPGYFALNFHRPMDIVLTLLVSLVTYLIVHQVSKFSIIYGRRRIVLMLLTGFVIGHVVRLLLAMPAMGMTSSATADTAIAVIGYIVPGLIALWFDRQGLFETLGTVLTASAVVRLALLVIGMEVLL
ncbi:poly-gamma-glutamate biosynthesis protein PgsC [Aeoliella sp. ICT_H6.2]|uniref:Poly-gamma-glutamate biosynthesis protein PgsC n=1 Tax=Aeoliella straminimaris TaxID=2954799 RepID=A0A9X2JJA9_9BACT|nr:poly-gamma-glutamate biosynthesis protein PgsC [Aeoliella straminimaris]MCO6047980.1 poly-gamma-glutamate biosynthesis protein PgsC [Aeoliella straminimaris]